MCISGACANLLCAGVSVIESGKQLYAGIAERTAQHELAVVRPKLRIASRRDTQAARNAEDGEAPALAAESTAQSNGHSHDDEHHDDDDDEPLGGGIPWLERYRPDLAKIPLLRAASEAAEEYLTNPEKRKELGLLLLKNLQPLVLRAGGVVTALATVLLDGMLTLFFFSFFLKKIALGQSRQPGRQRPTGQYLVETIFSSGWLPNASTASLREAQIIIDEIIAMLQTWVQGYVWIIIIETVGAGQSEVDIARLAHTTIVVEAPGLGDEIQAIKAGAYDYVEKPFQSDRLLTMVRRGIEAARLRRENRELRRAVREGKPATAELLLARGANIHQRSDAGLTALAYAKQANDNSMVQRLVKAGVTVATSGVFATAAPRFASTASSLWPGRSTASTNGPLKPGPNPSDNVSYAMYMLANMVSPPTLGIRRLCNSDAFGGAHVKEKSVCHCSPLERSEVRPRAPGL